jgi:hypothetical protein
MVCWFYDFEGAAGNSNCYHLLLSQSESARIICNLCTSVRAPCIVMSLYNITHQNKSILNYYFIFLNFLIPSTCFGPEGLSSGIRQYIQIRHIVFYVQLYNQSSRQTTVYTEACRTYCIITVYTTVLLKTFGFEICRRHNKIKKIKTLIQERCILLLYIL